MKITVKDAKASVTHSIEVNDTDTVGELKALIETQIDLPAAQQRLIYSGKVSDESQCWHTYSFQ